MKNLLIIFIFSSCFIMSAQNDLEIEGTIVNKQNLPIKSATVSIPSAFLRTVTSQDGKFNLSLANVYYETDDIIEISIKDKEETLKMTINDYLKLDKKVFIMNDGNVDIPKNKKAITTNKKETSKYTEVKKTSLTFDNIVKGNKISIKNQKGKTFYTELIETSYLKKKEFDLNYLKDGYYYFEIEKKLQTNVIPFTISFEKGITYLEDKKITHYKPHFKIKNETVILTQLSQNGEPVTINIYDENNQLLYNDTTENELDIQRVFKLEKGSFKFIITSNNNEYETSINTYD